MTIDECIYYETSIERTGCERRYTKYEHQQIAEWLKELKAKRNICEYAYKQGYSKGIEDFKAECHKQISKNTEKYGFNQRDLVNLDLAEIDMIAEQLKGGARDEI